MDGMTIMAKRKALSDKTRFEVFKRDKFTCQYCGKGAPEVVLHADHVTAVANGGGNDILNLVTSCSTCNSGKGARPLSDDSAVTKQKAMLSELEERRQQLEMMVQWRDELQGHVISEVDIVAKRIGDRGPFVPNETGRLKLKTWIKAHGVATVLKATDEAFDTYGQFIDDKMTVESWDRAFNKIPGIIRVWTQSGEKPYLRRLMYIQGIIRNCTGQSDVVCIPLLEHIHLAGESLDDLERYAKTVGYPSHILSYYEEWLKSVGHPYLGTDKGFTYRNRYSKGAA